MGGFVQWLEHTWAFWIFQKPGNNLPDVLPNFKKFATRYNLITSAKTLRRSATAALRTTAAIDDTDHHRKWMGVGSFWLQSHSLFRGNHNLKADFKPGWWFGTFFIFPYTGNRNPNWLLYFSEGLAATTNQKLKGSTFWTSVFFLWVWSRWSSWMPSGVLILSASIAFGRVPTGKTGLTWQLSGWYVSSTKGGRVVPYYCEGDSLFQNCEEPHISFFSFAYFWDTPNYLWVRIHLPNPLVQ